MSGGEIFIPKMPSVKVIDLAKAIGKNIKLVEIGMRPGEKVHESLFSKEDCEFIFETNKFYIIEPTIRKFKNIKSLRNIKKKKLNKYFSYISNENKFLSTSEIKNLIKLNEK